MVFVTLVRHGETEMNKANIVQSRTHGDLTAEGVQMAEKLGKQLKDEKFTRIVSSDLKRCHDTTKNILKHSKHHSPEEIVLNPILRERDYGDFEFLPGNVVAEQVAKEGGPSNGIRGHNVRIPGGEDYEKVMVRCAQFFEELCNIADKTEMSENILVVSHGCWIMAFLDHLVEHPDYDLADYEHAGPDARPVLNTAKTKFFIGKSEGENNNGKRSIKFYDVVCTAHLKTE